MKIVVAIDSLKGSLSSIQAGNIIKEGVLSVLPQAQVIVCPLADGGEGTTEALVEGLGGTLVTKEVTGPFNTPVSAQYGVLSQTKTAVMEMAAAAGITLFPQKDPLTATTRGVGELILDAMEHQGCRHFIIGIGGSATNDGGVGMLQSLGFSFLDESGTEIRPGAQDLGKIQRISANNAHSLLKECTFSIACDVDNPLCGQQGATYIFGPQKGVTPQQAPVIDGYLASFADKTEEFFQKDNRNHPGVGAAGGLGFAFLSYLGGTLTPGVDLVLDAVHIDDYLPGATLLFTGEGCLDQQTVMGKAPIGVAKRGKKQGCTVIALAGILKEGAEACNQEGIDALFSILTQVVPLEQALDPQVASRNLLRTTQQVMRLYSAGR